MALRKRRPGLVYPVREDWHYVGEAGEPAFETGWSNFGGGVYPGLAFRLRETGVVDVVGLVSYAGGGSTALFQLPAKYRPVNAAAVFPYVAIRSGSSIADIAVVVTSGFVGLTGATTSDRAHIAGSFFIDAAIAAT